jgi:hypothetical protein
MQQLTCYGCNVPLKGDYESKKTGNLGPGYYKLSFSHSNDAPGEYWTYDYCKPCYVAIQAMLMKRNEQIKKGAKR